MRKNGMKVTQVMVLTTLAWALSGGAKCSAAPAEATQDGEPCRIIINYDEFNLFRYQTRWLAAHLGRDPEPQEIASLLEQIVDEHAKAKVDRLVQCLFSLPWGVSPPGFKSFPRAPQRGWFAAVPGVAGFEDAGNDLVEFVLDRSHQNGMQFLAGVRMNDRHPNAEKQPFFVEHPQWHLGKDFGGALDYKYEGVRDAMLTFMQEVLERYDVDGIELDWMRHCRVFKEEEAEQHAPLLNDFIEKLRGLLDAAARRRGRDRLLLGVRVPQTIQECQFLGFDLESWAQNGVDYICPADFHFMDFNIQVEDFVEKIQGTDCQLFPSIYGTLSQEGSSRRGLTHEQFRAAAHNYYAFGAQGVSPYNFYTQFMILPGNEFLQAPPGLMLGKWPRALGYLTALRDPETVARGDKHYLYYPLHIDKSSTGARKHQVIKLPRSGGQSEGATRLRMAEDLTSSRRAGKLKFKVAGMEEEDRLEIRLNGKLLPDEAIGRKFVEEGQTEKIGREIPPFYLYEMRISTPPAVYGDNELALRLVDSAGSEDLEAQEFEIVVTRAHPLKKAK
jgi:hypothetical protein